MTVLFTGTVKFKQHILKHKRYEIKIYKLCDPKGLKYECVFRQKKQRASPSITATYATVTGLAVRLENVGHKLHTDNFFSLPGLYDDLHTGNKLL
jgi:hypothetical protein